METDLATCANDPAACLQVHRVAHASLGAREDCWSVVGCRATPEGWKVAFEEAPQCTSQELALPAPLGSEVTGLACSSLEPLPETSWYDAEAFEVVRLRYRFGTAVRKHCAVPNWRLLQEEPLRFYAVLQARSRTLSRTLVNIGAGDAGWDDPLGAVLLQFADPASPWRGVYFEATQQNCETTGARLASTGDIHLECAYSTPDSVRTVLCDRLVDTAGPHPAACAAPGERPSEGADVRVDVDAMSIDIDSYDCAVLREALLVVSPRMIIVETTAFPPPIAVASEFTRASSRPSGTTSPATLPSPGAQAGARASGRAALSARSSSCFGRTAWASTGSPRATPCSCAETPPRRPVSPRAAPERRSPRAPPTAPGAGGGRRPTSSSAGARSVGTPDCTARTSSA